MKIPVFHAALHFGEESLVAGNERSGMVNFAGCHLACAHCYTPEATSQQFGTRMSAAQFAVQLRQLVSDGAKNINLISPTHLWPDIEAPLADFRRDFPTLPLVLKISGYEGSAFLDRMAQLADVFVPDFKVSGDAAARAVALPAVYGTVAERAFQRMLRTHGEPIYNPARQLQRGIVARHLLMPGFDEDSRQVVRRLGALRFSGWLNLMTRFVRPGHGGLVRASSERIADLLTLADQQGVAVLVDGKETRHAIAC